MANNYLQFSFTLDLPTETARTWASDVVEFLDGLDELDDLWLDGGTSDDGRTRTVHPNVDKYPLATALDGDVDPDWVGYTAEAQDDELWVYAEESGIPENAVALVQDYLRRFNPDGCEGFTWSYTCSKMRTDEFDGGAVFITATTEDYIVGNSWLAGKMMEHRARREAQDGQP